MYSSSGILMYGMPFLCAPTSVVSIIRRVGGKKHIGPMTQSLSVPTTLLWLWKTGVSAREFNW